LETRALRAQEGKATQRRVVEELQWELFHDIPVPLLSLVTGTKLAQLCQNKQNNSQRFLSAAVQ